MTVSVETNKTTYVGNGSTTVFASVFEIFDDDDILVEVVTDSTGAVATQTKTTHYTVSSISSPKGSVNITMLTAPASGETLVLRRNQPQSQATDYVENDDFPAQTHENNLDKIVFMVQEHEEKLNRAFLLNPSNSSNELIPDATASYVLQRNAAGNGYSWVATASLGVGSLLDEDDMVSDSVADGATQQSIKAYIDSGTITFTNKTIDSASNTVTVDLSEATVTGTTAEFNTALSDGSFATLAGTETLTNKTINTANNTITIVEADISDLGSYLTASSTDTLTNKTINTASNTITIVEADISDLGSYITASSVDTLTNKTIDTASNTITVVEADISDLGSYITASSTDTLTNKTFDANGTGNSISNVDLTADITGTLPVANGGTGVTAQPSFSASLSSDQTLTTGVFTKLAFATEVFDTNSNFDNATNYRFTPTVAGKYIITLTAELLAAVAGTQFLVTLYKNGSENRRGNVAHGYDTSSIGSTVSVVMDFNGSTDYVEAYALHNNGANADIGSSAAQTHFTGVFITA